MRVSIPGACIGIGAFIGRRDDVAEGVVCPCAVWRSASIGDLGDEATIGDGGFFKEQVTVIDRAVTG